MRGQQNEYTTHIRAFSPQYTILVSTIPPKKTLLYISPHFPYVKVNSHVSLFRRKFWDSKVIYRGSAAGVLVMQGFVQTRESHRKCHRKVTTYI